MSVSATRTQTFVRPDGFVSTLVGDPRVSGYADGSGSLALFNTPLYIALYANASLALVVDMPNFVVRRVDISSRAVITLAGSHGMAGTSDGAGTSSRFNYMRGVTTSDAFGYAYVADAVSHTIRRIALDSGLVSTVAGAAGVAGSANGVGVSARFSFPGECRVTLPCAILVIVDAGNEILRIVDVATWTVNTLAGVAGSAWVC